MRLNLTAHTEIDHPWRESPQLGKVRTALTKLARKAPPTAELDVSVYSGIGERDRFNANTTLTASWVETV